MPRELYGNSVGNGRIPVFADYAFDVFIKDSRDKRVRGRFTVVSNVPSILTRNKTIAADPSEYITDDIVGLGGGEGLELSITEVFYEWLADIAPRNVPRKQWSTTN